MTRKREGGVSIKAFQTFSENTVFRLPKYIRLLDELDQNGITRTSSATIGQILGMTPSQVRQDLSCFGNYGAQGYGYSVSTLKENLKKVIGLDRHHNIAFMGVGSIGRAFLCHMKFEENNYHVVAGFDINEELVGTKINGVEIFHPDALALINQATPIDICILAVSGDEAKSMAKEIKKNKIPSIWNLTNVDLGLNDNDIIVEDIHFLDSLYGLTFYLNQNTQH